jgi:hypothetical protein
MDVVEVLTDAELELVLAGRAVPGRADLDDLARALTELRERAAAEPVPPMGIDLRIDLAEAEVRASRAAEPAGPPERPERRAGPLRRSGLVAAAAALVALVLGVGATQDALPRGLQDIAASAARQLGITLPVPAVHADPPGLRQPGAERVEVARPAKDRPAGSGNGAGRPEVPGAPGTEAPGLDGVADPPDRSGNGPDEERDRGPEGSQGSEPQGPASPRGEDPAPSAPEQPRSQPQPQQPHGEPDAPAAPDDQPAPEPDGDEAEPLASDPGPADRRPDHAPGPSSAPSGAGPSGAGPGSPGPSGGAQGASGPGSARLAG